MLRSKKSCVDSAWGMEQQWPRPSFLADCCVVVVSVRSSVFRVRYQLCVKQMESASLLWHLVKAFFSLIVWKWREIGRNFLSRLACCYEIMWKCFCYFLVTHEWLCLEHILREHMLLVLLMLNYLFLCCLPTAPTSVRFWSVNLWLRLRSLRIMQKTPTNNSSKSLNTTTFMLFCRCLGACLIKLGGKNCPTCS